MPVAEKMAVIQEPWERPETDGGADERLARAVHDLKTPLTALKQALQVLSSGRAGDLTPTQARFVTMGLDNAAVLTSLMDRMRAPPNVPRMVGDFRPSRTCVRDSVDLVLNALEASAESRGMHLTAIHAPSVPHAWADEHLLRRLLMNLVGNAIKHGAREGHACVTVDLADQEAQFVTISVTDDGPGVPEQDHARVFDPRFRGRVAEAESEGSGLGLAIVHDIATAHGGKVSIHNNPSRGCTFTVTLPIFGTGRGSQGHFSQLASALHGPLEMAVIAAESGAADRLADALAPCLPGWSGVFDLGGACLGLVRQSTSDAHDSRDTYVELASLLRPHADLVAAAGVATAPSGTLDSRPLVALALASQRPFPFLPLTAGQRGCR